MRIKRRDLLLSALALTGILAPEPVRVQQLSDFDAVGMAKLRAGEIAREITASPRDPSIPEPSWDATFNDGLLLQAGLRALLPVKERRGVAAKLRFMSGVNKTVDFSMGRFSNDLIYAESDR
jgi:hypothetical protein